MDKQLRSSVTIRDLQQIPELESVRQLEALVWSVKESVPVTQTSAAIKNGGFILGAFLEEELIGFQYSFPGYDGRGLYLYSHSLGIHPDYRKLGIGEKLKRAQKIKAMELGYDLIKWTFDPLETVNGYLNLHKLGATCSDYMENAYGEIPDELNAGIPSDRFLVEWRMNRPQQSPRENLVDEHKSVIKTIEKDGHLTPGNTDLTAESDRLLVPVPGNFQELKQTNFSLAHGWREATREVFTHYLARGWNVTDLLKRDRNSYYYLIEKTEDKGTS